MRKKTTVMISICMIGLLLISGTVIGDPINGVGVNAQGEVGIGILPTYGLLTVYRDDALTGWPNLFLEQNGTGDATIKWGVTDSNTWTMGLDNDDDDKLKIGYHTTKDAGVNGDTKLTIQRNGYVGIGTENPNAMLEIWNKSASDTEVLRLTRRTNSDQYLSIHTDVGPDDGGKGYSFIPRYFDGSSYVDGSMFHINAKGDVSIGNYDPYPGMKLSVLGGGIELGQFGGNATNYSDTSHSIQFWGKSGCAPSQYMHNAGRIYGKMNGCAWPETELHLEAGTEWDSFVANQLVLKGSGFVGIGTSTPQCTLHVNGNIKALNCCTDSDIRWKKNITTVDSSLDRVCQLRGVNYNWKDEEKGEGLQLGVIAQEVEEVFPEVVMTDSEGYKSVSYGKLVAPLIEAVKELKAENIEAVQKLKAENEELKKRLLALEEKM